MVFGLSSCTIKLSTTSAPAGTPEPVPVNTTNDYVPYVPTSGFTLEDRMEEKTTIELVKADIGDDTYIAPAQDKTTHQWGYIDLSGKWVIQPKYKTASDFSGNIACVSDVYGTYFFIDRLGSVLFDEAAGTVVTAESSFSEGLANVSTAVEFTQKMTYIDTTGKMPVNLGKLPLAKGVTYKTSRYVELATPFRNGYALAMRTTNSTLEASGVNSLESAYLINEEGSVCSALPQGIDISEYGFDENMRVVIKAENGSAEITIPVNRNGIVYFELTKRIFTPDTVVDTTRGIVRGVLVEKDPLGNITLETAPGVQQRILAPDVRKVSAIEK